MLRLRPLFRQQAVLSHCQQVGDMHVLGDQGLTQTTSRASASERAEGRKASAACSRGAWAKPPCQKQGHQKPCNHDKQSQKPGPKVCNSTEVTAQSKGPHYVPDAPHLRSAGPPQEPARAT